MTLKALTEDKACPVCGGQDFTLCEDLTDYTRVSVEDGKLTLHYSHQEKSDSDIDPLGPVRLLCGDCGEYLDVPEELL